MLYYVNGKKLNRNELEKKVLEAVLELGEENAPAIAYRKPHTVEHNVRQHACMIARRLGWDFAK